MSDDIVIKVDHASKTFKLPHEKTNSIKSAVINFYRRKKTYEKLEALKDISFEVKRGEFFGIVGRNGSGKSTLLKMLAGTYVPTGGTVQVHGKLTPFIELGVGFNPELTGRENIFLNGALLGFNRKEMQKMYKDIVEFAELEKFMDQKLKNYSSGMQVRLAFSIAIRAQSDILLFDEVLAVGDASFQQKCYEVFADMSSDGRTVVLVTHDMSAVQRFCKRALLIEDGLIKMMGNPGEVADQYLEQNFGGGTGLSGKRKKANEAAGKFEIDEVVLSSAKGPTKSFSLNEGIELGFRIKNKSSQKNLAIGFQVFTNAGVYCFGTNTKLNSIAPISGVENDIKVSLSQNLTPGTYHVTLAVMNSDANKVLYYLPKVAIFNIKQETEIQGVALLDTKWSVNNV